MVEIDDRRPAACPAATSSPGSTRPPATMPFAGAVTTTSARSCSRRRSGHRPRRRAPSRRRPPPGARRPEHARAAACRRTPAVAAPDTRLGHLPSGHGIVALLLRAGAILEELLETGLVGAGRVELRFTAAASRWPSRLLAPRAWSMSSGRAPACSNRSWASACARSARAGQAPGRCPWWQRHDDGAQPRRARLPSRRPSRRVRALAMRLGPRSPPRSRSPSVARRPRRARSAPRG